MSPTTHRHAHALPEEPVVPTSREKAEGRGNTRTMALRAGLVALALSVAVSGGAYAAVRVGHRNSVMPSWAFSVTSIRTGPGGRWRRNGPAHRRSRRRGRSQRGLSREEHFYAHHRDG